MAAKKETRHFLPNLCHTFKELNLREKKKQNFLKNRPDQILMKHKVTHSLEVPDHKEASNVEKVQVRTLETRSTDLM